MMQKVLLVLLCAFIFSVHAEPALLLPEIALQLNDQTLTVEVASNSAQREYGLMNRRALPADHGMLFVFKQPTRFGMWMKNTLIPLSVAFIDEHGNVINIEDMQPQTLNVHSTARPAQFAIEANLHWFAEHGVNVGSHVGGLERAPPAQ